MYTILAIVNHSSCSHPSRSTMAMTRNVTGMAVAPRLLHVLEVSALSLEMKVLLDHVNIW